MTAVITGANGHLGCNLIRRMVADGQPVRAMVHRNTEAMSGLDVQQVQASLFDESALARAFAGADTVIHCAAKISIVGDPDGTVQQTNVLGARNAARAARAAGVERFVHVSSVHAFDLRRGGPITEESPRAGPHNYAYDHSKFLGEQEVRKEIERGLDATIVNPTGIIGPNDFAPSRMGSVLLDLHARRMPALVAGGFDFVDVRDVVEGTLRAVNRGARGENHLLGGTHVTIQELARAVEEVVGAKAPRAVMPLALAYLGLPFAALAARLSGGQPKFTRESLGALKHGRVVECSKARRELGYAPRPLHDSIRDVYDWFQQQEKLNV